MKLFFKSKKRSVKCKITPLHLEIMGSVKLSFILLWLSHFFMDFFTGIWPIYKTIAKIDPLQAGLAIGAAGFIGEILQIGFGYFSDKGHRKKILILGLCLASAIIWITFAEGIFYSFALLLLLMLGSAAFHPSATGLVGILSKQNKGRGILLFASGGAIGFAISQITFTRLIAVFQGHAWIVLIPLGICIIGIALHRFPMQEIQRHTLSLKGFFAPIMHCRKPLLILYFSQITNLLLVSSFQFFLPDILLAKGCHHWLCYGGGHLFYALGAATLMIPAGFLSDKFGPKAVMLSALCSSILMLYFLLATPMLSIGWSIAILTCLGGFLGVVNPVIVSWGNRLVPESPSTVSALLMGFAWCFGNLGCVFSGLLISFFVQDSIVNTLAIMGLFLGVALTLVLFMPRLAQEEAPASI
jgi:FSR family fosmidomycin resistance protein-like MFS transporter